MTGRATALAVVALLLLPGVAHGAGLVPLAPRSAWGSTPIHVAAPVNDPRVFVVERGGAVRIVRGGVLQSQPFLTVPGVDTSGERGLLSIAFPPDHAQSGRFYVFAVVGGEIRILEHRVSANPDVADAGSQRIVYALPVVAGNHIGGQLAFGPDGRLYATIGDNAVRERAQDPASPFGKVLRFDVTQASPAPEVWALGLRNPYRAAFAPDGSFVIGDVGEGTWEEVNVAGVAGRNFGWPRCEGLCSPANVAYTDPVYAYRTRDGSRSCGAVIGGVVVRDPDLAGLTGRYLFGDLCGAPLWTLDLAAAGGDQRAAGASVGSGLIGFGEDAFACVYALADGTASRVAPSGASGAACPRGPSAFVSTPAPIVSGGSGAAPRPTAPAAAAEAAVPLPASTRRRPGRLRVASGGLRADTRGRVRVAVRCVGATSCTGRLRLRTTARVRLIGSKQARRLDLAARGVPRIAAGRLSRLTVALSARERRLLRNVGRLRVRVTVVTHAGGGARPASVSELPLRRR